MSNLSPNQLLPDWLAILPLVEAPVTLGEETHHAFTEHNLPLPQALSDAFILPYEPEPVQDEFTEYIPCFRLDHGGAHHICVYWRVSLMNYEYFLATFSPEGKQIDRALIAGTYMRKGTLLQRVAFINEDLRVVSSEARLPTDGTDFDLSSSVQSIFDIHIDGRLIWLGAN